MSDKRFSFEQIITACLMSAAGLFLLGWRLSRGVGDAIDRAVTLGGPR